MQYVLYIFLVLECMHTQSPVIGIFTQPSKIPNYPSTQYSYIAASYVKFIESSGGRVIPIPYDATYLEMDIIFNNINGILLTGGGTLLDGPSSYSQQIGYLFNKALQSNKNGDYFPIMGICLGHELIHYILSGYDPAFKITVNGQNKILHTLKSVDAQSIIYSRLNHKLLHSIQTDNLSYFHHLFAISRDLYDKYPLIQQTLKITATDIDDNGIEFIASTQGIQYPILTMQYHPEKNPFEWTIPSNHSLNGILVSQQHGNAFIEMAQHNTHIFNLNNQLIYNYKPIVIPDYQVYTSVYIFNKSQNE